MGVNFLPVKMRKITKYIHVYSYIVHGECLTNYFQASLVRAAWRAAHFTPQPAACISCGWGSNMSQTRMRAKPANSSLLAGSLLSLDSDFKWMRTSVLQGCHQVPHSAHQHLGSHANVFISGQAEDQKVPKGYGLIFQPFPNQQQ